MKNTIASRLVMTISIVLLVLASAPACSLTSTPTTEPTATLKPTETPSPSRTAMPPQTAAPSTTAEPTEMATPSFTAAPSETTTRTVAPATSTLSATASFTPAALPTFSPTAPPTQAPTTAEQTLTLTPMPPVADIPAFQGLLLIYRASSGIAGLCQDLAIFESGRVLYGPCGALRTATLPEEWRVQLAEWQGRCRPFDYRREDNPGRPDSLMTSLLLNGTGQETATDADQEKVVAWARDLYAQLTAPASTATPRATPQATASPQPREAALAIWEGPGLRLRYPADVQITSVDESHWSFTGPDISLRPVEADWAWSGPAYRVEIVQYDNPDEARSIDWAREHLRREWRDAKERGEPFTGPVNKEGQLDEEKTGLVRLGDKAALRADWAGGDHVRRAIYLSLRESVVAFLFDLYPIANNPVADVASDIYGLLLAQVEAPGAEGAPDTVPHAQDVTYWTGPGFAITIPSYATASEVEVDHWQIVGPEIAVRPLDAEWFWEGPAYQLDLVLHENEEGLTAVAWAEQHLRTEWEKARDGGEPFTGPVDAEGNLIADRVAQVLIGGAIAYQADWVAGDAVHRVIYINAASKILALHYDRFPTTNHPAAPLADAVHVLLLGSLRTASP